MKGRNAIMEFTQGMKVVIRTMLQAFSNEEIHITSFDKLKETIHKIILRGNIKGCNYPYPIIESIKIIFDDNRKSDFTISSKNEHTDIFPCYHIQDSYFHLMAMTGFSGLNYSAEDKEVVKEIINLYTIYLLRRNYHPRIAEIPFRIYGSETPKVLDNRIKYLQLMENAFMSESQCIFDSIKEIISKEKDFKDRFPLNYAHMYIND